MLSPLNNFSQIFSQSNSFRLSDFEMIKNKFKRKSLTISPAFFTVKSNDCILQFLVAWKFDALWASQLLLS